MFINPRQCKAENNIVICHHSLTGAQVQFLPIIPLKCRGLCEVLRHTVGLCIVYFAMIAVRSLSYMLHKQFVRTGGRLINL